MKPSHVFLGDSWKVNHIIIARITNQLCNYCDYSNASYMVRYEKYLAKTWNLARKPGSKAITFWVTVATEVSSHKCIRKIANLKDTKCWKHCYLFRNWSIYRHCVTSVQIQRSFWSVFSCIRTEYGDLLCKSPYSVQIQENTEQKKPPYLLDTFHAVRD